MKKLFALLMLVCVLAFSLGTPSIAQEDTTAMDVDTTGVEAEDTTATTAFEKKKSLRLLIWSLSQFKLIKLSTKW